jgi:UDP-3-O-[3-hydroxymyristoyl] N-acetylglucosamine deacetylase/3-hydroxyacyl-[acyl-carrier-protein] dehydratase
LDYTLLRSYNDFQTCPSNNGFTFVRVDLEGHPVVEADANYVVNTQRGTNLEKLGKIQTQNMCPSGL